MGAESLQSNSERMDITSFLLFHFQAEIKLPEGLVLISSLLWQDLKEQCEADSGKA